MGVRICTIDDIKQVEELFAELAQVMGVKSSFDLEKSVDQLKKLQALANTYAQFVFEENNSILGFMSMVFIDTLFQTHGIAFINELIVKNDSSKKAIGKILIDKAIEIATERGMFELHSVVMNSNKEGHRFYKKNGFNQEYILLRKTI